MQNFTNKGSKTLSLNLFQKESKAGMLLVSYTVHIFVQEGKKINKGL